jgi:hypothetical protein
MLANSFKSIENIRIKKDKYCLNQLIEFCSNRWIKMKLIQFN